MSTAEFVSDPIVAAAGVPDPKLTRDLLAHLRDQLRSAERMLKVVNAQGVAIRARDSKEVVARACDLQVEINRREALENERIALMERAGRMLGRSADEVTLTELIELMDENEAHAARERQLTLRRQLRIIQREHTTNQALMRQELNFLAHLLGQTGSTGAYGSAGQRPTVHRRALPGSRPSLDLEA